MIGDFSLEVKSELDSMARSTVDFMVSEVRFELTTSWIQAKHATNCATH